MKLEIGISRYEITTPISEILGAAIRKNGITYPLRHTDMRLMRGLLEENKEDIMGFPNYISRTMGCLWFYPPPDEEYEVVVRYYDMVREL